MMYHGCHRDSLFVPLAPKMSLVAKMSTTSRRPHGSSFGNSSRQPAAGIALALGAVNVLVLTELVDCGTALCLLFSFLKYVLGLSNAPLLRLCVCCMYNVIISREDVGMVNGQWSMVG